MCRPAAAIGACLLSYLCAAQAAALCLSGKPALADEFARSAFVIHARVVKATVQSAPDDPAGAGATRYSLRVVEAFKGKPARTFAFDSENTSSRIPLREGRRYLLFVQGPVEQGFVDACGNSGSIRSRQQAIGALRAWAGRGATLR